MPIRFNRRISLGKFLKLNISKSGVGVTVGLPGARLSAGPRGTNLTLGLPGTGLSYTQKIDGTPLGRFAAAAGSPLITSAPIRDPGPFAPDYEKDLVKGLNDLQAGQPDAALPHFLAAAPEESAAAIYAAFILATQPEGRPQAIALLETVVGSDAKLPSVLMQKYLATATLPVTISPAVSAQVPLHSSAAPLLLAELYQANGQVDDAIGLLESIAELAADPCLTLSLCELLGSQGRWDEIIELAKDTSPIDEVSLETKLWYGRAMLEKGLAEAAISVLSEVSRKKKGVNARLVYEARYWRAIAYGKLGKKGHAHKEFQKLYADDPDFRDVAQRVKAK